MLDAAAMRPGTLVPVALLLALALSGGAAGNKPPSASRPQRTARKSTFVESHRRLVDNLPIAEKMVAHLEQQFGPRPLHDTVLFNIRHGTPDAPAYDGLYRRLGVEPEDHVRVTVPYSGYRWVNEQIKAGGNGKPTIPRGVASMQRTVERQLEVAIRRALDTGKQLVVVEDGGYLAAATMRGRVTAILARLAKHPAYRDKVASLKFQGSTEQTTAGLRRYVEAAPRLNKPVFDVASTDLKQEAEGPGVGQTVARALEDWMMPYESLMGKQLVMFGNGRVGEPTINTMFGRGVTRMTVVDPDRNALQKTARLRRLWKSLDGRTLEATPPEALSVGQIRTADVFLDMTGYQTIGKQVIDHARDGAWIASGSSKRNAVDWKYLDSRTVARTPRPWGTLYTLDDGRTLKVVANGEVVNFWRRNASIPSERIDPVYSMLIWGTVTMARTPPKEPGIHAIPQEVQDTLRGWMRAPR